jgi:chemotaxis protein CheX
VKRVGAQCMQLIVSAHLTWERDGLHLTLTRPSEELAEAFEVAGISIDGFTERGAAQ